LKNREFRELGIKIALDNAGRAVTLKGKRGQQWHLFDLRRGESKTLLQLKESVIWILPFHDGDLGCLLEA